MSYSDEQWIEILLRRWNRKGYATNLAISPEPLSYQPLLHENERCIADISCTTGGHVLITTIRVLHLDAGMVLEIPYKDIVGWHWVTDSPDLKLAGRLKRVYPYRLILDRRDGGKVVLDDLGQAVFPLIKVIQFLMKQRRREN